MTLPEWRVKRGDDWTAPQDVLVLDGGVAVDLTDDWTVACQARQRPDASTAVDLTVDDDTALLELGKVRLSLVADDTAAMAPGTWLLDVQCTHPTTGRHTSETFTLSVVADITRVVVP